MPSFSKSSLERLSTCDVKLQNLFKEVVKYFDCTIIEGHRTLEKQEEYFKAGRSKTMNSKHLSSPSKAVDVAPFPINWSDIQRFCFFGGFVLGIAKKMGIDIRWGGDWNSNNDLKDNNFNDYPHFELVE